MALLSVQKPSGIGSELIYANASIGDQVPNSNLNSILYIRNDDTASKTITINATLPCDQGTLHNINVSIPAGKVYQFAFFNSKYNDSNGNITITYSATTNVKVAVMQV